MIGAAAASRYGLKGPGQPVPIDLYFDLPGTGLAPLETPVGEKLPALRALYLPRGCRFFLPFSTFTHVYDFSLRILQ